MPIGVVLVPRLRPYLANDYPFDYLHDRIISVCKKIDVPYVDLREDFKPLATDIRSLHVNKYDAHPNGFANEIIANRIMGKFGPIWQQNRLTVNLIVSLCRQLSCNSGLNGHYRFESIEG